MAVDASCYNCLFVSSPSSLLEGMDQAFLFSVTGTWEALHEYLWTDCPLRRGEAQSVGSTSKSQKRYLGGGPWQAHKRREKVGRPSQW